MKEKFCMLDLLQLDTVSGSCFSASQIQALYLYYGFELIEGMTSEDQLRKLNKEKSFRHIFDHVMKDPVNSEYGPSFLYDLQMSFRPILKNQQNLEVQDLENIMSRYCFWLRNIVIVTIGSLNDFALNRITKMYHNPERRYFVAFRISEGYWSVVLIDKSSKTFEYYDPLFLSSHWDDISQFYEVVKSLDKDVKIKTSELTRRGFTKTNLTNPKQCGFACLQFLHSRMVENKSFEEIVNQDLNGSQCDKLREIFFHTMNPRFVSSCKSEFPDSVHQVALLNFLSFIDYLTKINDDLELKEMLREYEIELKKSFSNSSKIANVALTIQETLVQVLSEPLIEYVGTDIWQRIVEEICDDPLTAYLMNLESKSRIELMLALFEDINLVNNGSIDSFSQYLLKSLEIIIKSENPLEFLKSCGNRKNLLYVGVYFLRECAQKSIGNLKINELYPYHSNLVKPLHNTNLYEIEKTITRCDEILEEAISLLYNEMSNVVSQNTLELIDFPKLMNIINYNQLDISKQTFLENGLEGWNFPLADTNELLEKLEPRFRTYSLNTTERQACFDNPLFLIYYSIGVFIFLYSLKQNPQQDETKTIIVESIRDFYKVAENNKNVPNKSVLCVLLKLLNNPMYDCDEIKSKSQSEEFLKQAKLLYREIIKK